VDAKDRRFAYDPIGNRTTSLDDRSWVRDRNALKRCMVAIGVPRQRRRPARRPDATEAAGSSRPGPVAGAPGSGGTSDRAGGVRGRKDGGHGPPYGAFTAIGGRPMRAAIRGSCAVGIHRQ
jgi:hypothetical protein